MAITKKRASKSNSVSKGLTAAAAREEKFAMKKPKKLVPIKDRIPKKESLTPIKDRKTVTASGLTTAAARKEQFATKRATKPTSGTGYIRKATNRKTGNTITTSGTLTPTTRADFNSGGTGKMKKARTLNKKTTSSAANYGKLTRDEQRLHGKK